MRAGDTAGLPGTGAGREQGGTVALQSLLLAPSSHLGNELEIEGSRDLKLLAHGMHDGFDPLQGFGSDVLWWGHQCGIS